MSDVRWVRLEDLTEPDRSITYGVVKPGPEPLTGGVTLIRGGDISGGRISSELRKITDEVSRPYRRTLLRGGELVMSLVGNPGAVAIVPDHLAGANLARQAALIALRQDVDARYVMYWFMSSEGQRRLASVIKGSVQQVINLADLKRQEVYLPPLETQRRIAAILGAYDDLIEVNRRRVAVLEEMAQGLFDELLRSPIEGPTIGELYEASLGGDWGTEEADDEHSVKVRVVRGTDIPRLQTGDYSSCPERFISSKSAAKRVLQRHDLVLENSINAKTRPAGTTLLVTAGLLEELGGDAIAASFCRVFKFKSPRTALLVHHYCRHMHRTREIERFQTVAANGIANFQTQVFLKECRLPIDVEHNEEAFSLLESLNEGGSLIGRQTSRLAASRDLLLPRLISGQLSVEAAERELENAA